MTASDIEMLNILAKATFEENRDKEFWSVPGWVYNGDDAMLPEAYMLLKKMEKLGLVVTEIAEAMEGIRKPARSDHIPEFSLEEEELADAMIRLLDYAGGFNLRLGEAIAAKLKFNASRPPKHGKLF